MGRSISGIAAVLASTMTVSYMDTLISDQEKFVYHEAVEVGGVTVGLIQMAMGNDAEENIRTAGEKVRGAIAAGANIICLPELFYSRIVQAMRMFIVACSSFSYVLLEQLAIGRRRREPAQAAGQRRT